MRLDILDAGHGLGKKALFAMIRLASGQPTPEPLKLMTYRGDFFGDAMRKVSHEAMRGPSAWSVGDRELMAAVVSQANECPYCIQAHAAVSARAYGDEAKVRAVLADLEAAPIDEPLRATLRMLRTRVREGTVTADAMRAVLTAGVTHAQVVDALSVAYVFDITNRLANAFDFAVPGPAAFEAGAKFLLSHGYK